MPLNIELVDKFFKKELVQIDYFKLNTVYYKKQVVRIELIPYYNKSKLPKYVVNITNYLSPRPIKVNILDALIDQLIYISRRQNHETTTRFGMFVEEIGINTLVDMIQNLSKYQKEQILLSL